MKVLQMFFCVILLCVTSVLVEAKSTTKGDETASKRNFAQFAAMTYHTTHRWPKKYVGYGCYCGLGGYGIPVDPIDECCKTHDACYKKVEDSGICSYSWAIYLTIYKRKGGAECSEDNEKCQMEVCKCDSVAAKCLGKYKDIFNEKYAGYDKKGKCDPSFTLS
uniref:Phospholipase A2 n=1 Tax=Calliactis polypus TaxID=656064 RepID=PLA2_CALPY